MCSCQGRGEGAPEAPFGLEQREIVSGLGFPDVAPGPVNVVDAFPSLTFAQPVFLTWAPDGTDRVFVVEVAGRIRVFPNDPSVASRETFLDIAPKVQSGGEKGLLGLAFDPDYASNGFFYVYYSAPASTPGTDHRSVLARYTVSSGDPNAADPASEVVLLTFDQPFRNHNGGCLQFGPDGMLYVGTGDGGSHDDPNGNAQDLTTLLGKILRLRPDGGVPADNPFVGAGGGVREEIWAFGLRNPWRFAFDRETGQLWCGDVGQNDAEEVDLVARGDDLGWDVFEGFREHENPHQVGLATTTAPVWDYGRNLGASVTGGAVYRGSANPSLVGAYVYADYVSGRVWALVYDGQRVVSNTLIATLTNPTSFGEDRDGELYACSFDGRIYRFEEPSGGPAALPQRLSETGLFTDTAALEPAPGLIEYDVNVPLWSDGAHKRRWIALPGTERIAFDPVEAWGFPAGTVLAKHFEIDTAPGVTRRLETRVLVRAASGWRGYVYKWDASGTDADLLPGSETEDLTIEDLGAPGGQRIVSWTYPDRADCFVCHTYAAGRVLGVRTRQLNRDFPYPAVTDNQLRAWNHVGLFDRQVGRPETLGALPRLEDTAAPLDQRARAYLAANCSYCHRPGGPTQVEVDLRYGIPTAAMNAVGVAPLADDLGLLQAAIVRPGAKESSVLWERMRRLDTTRMPPLGTRDVHQAALDVVGQWIDAGAP